jgi:hypothetical protein
LILRFSIRAVKKKENESFLRWKARNKAISKASVCKKSFPGYVLSPLSMQSWTAPALLPFPKKMPDGQSF